MINHSLSFLRGLVNIRHDAESNKVIVEKINKEVSFKGANFWLLMVAIFIASIGLDINSIPVIIGAMLISPLMGPIVGLGLALGTHDKILLGRSIKNLTIATVVGIVISTIYFMLSPVDTVQSELLARTSPTVFDVMIAFLGGLAGVVAIARKEFGNVVPGVAIATALMPPLCTIGFGIANGQFLYSGGALYLYAINCVFIFIATFLGVKYLKIPEVSYVNEEEKKKTTRRLTTLVFLMVVPAFYFAYEFVQENRFIKQAEQFVFQEFEEKGFPIVFKSIDYRAQGNTIEVILLNRVMTNEELNQLEEKLVLYGLSDVELSIVQGDALNQEQWNSTLSRIQNETEKVKAIEARLTNYYDSTQDPVKLLQEVRLFVPNVFEISINRHSFVDESVEAVQDDRAVSAVFTFIGELSEIEQEAIRQWIMLKLSNENIQVKFQETDDVL